MRATIPKCQLALGTMLREPPASAFYNPAGRSRLLLFASYKATPYLEVRQSPNLIELPLSVIAGCEYALWSLA